MAADNDEVIAWKYIPRYWPVVRGIQWSPVNSPHKGLWRGVLMFIWSAYGWTVGTEWTIVRLMIWDAIVPIMTSLMVDMLERQGISIHYADATPIICSHYRIRCCLQWWHTKIAWRQMTHLFKGWYICYSLSNIYIYIYLVQEIQIYVSYDIV